MDEIIKIKPNRLKILGEELNPAEIQDERIDYELKKLIDEGKLKILHLCLDK